MNSCMKSMNSGRLQSETVWCILAVTYALRLSDIALTVPSTLGAWRVKSRQERVMSVTMFVDRPGPSLGQLVLAERPLPIRSYGGVQSVYSRILDSHHPPRNIDVRHPNIGVALDGQFSGARDGRSCSRERSSSHRWHEGLRRAACHQRFPASVRRVLKLRNSAAT